jgi:alginate O-acetyltransferase complex protein AlgI
MLFNSFSFFIFLIVVFLFHWYVFANSKVRQNTFLLFVSYIFYSFWSVKFLCLLIFVTFIDYNYGLKVATNSRKKARLFLFLSLANNIGILFVFKYFNFFIEEFLCLLRIFDIHVNIAFLNLVLPVGISFYTFHGMSYIFDVYNSKRLPERNLIDYSLFVSYFPLLVAGPIERADHLLPQLKKYRIFSVTNFKNGIRLIIYGLFKKVVVADGLSPLVDTVFSNPANHNGYLLIFAAISFSFQIYCDFSAYSSIAIGVSKLFGIELITNFNYPYFAKNISEFWQRWHISLSSWFKDYLYIPLGGSKISTAITYRNILIVFLVSAFWHGANWTFLIWGFMHFLAYVPYVRSGKSILQNNYSYSRIQKCLKILLTFLFVTFCWIFFRSENLTNALLYLTKMFSNLNLYEDFVQVIIMIRYPILLILLILIIEFYNRNRPRDFSLGRRTNYFLIILLYISLMVMLNRDESYSFIYFQF